MPRTRSSKEGTLRSGAPYPQPAKQPRRRYHRAKKAAASEIAVMPKTAPEPIEISSDEETGTRGPCRRRNAARKCKREVIVISSDDEDARPLRSNTDGPVDPTRRELNRDRAQGRLPGDGGRSIAGNEIIVNDGSQQDIAMYEARLASYELEVASLRQRKEALAQAAAAAEDAAAATRSRVEDETLQLKAELAVEQAATHEGCRLLQVLADIISCDICSERMFKPVTLDCGHTFCQSCVTGWFHTIEEQHRELHPRYDPATVVPAPSAALLQHLSPLNRIVLAEVAEEHPRPPYTCPVCRKAVGGTVDCVMLKAVVEVVVEAEATGAQMKSGPKSG